MTPMDAVIPAGGTISTEYARQIGTEHRALAPVGASGAAVMQRVVDALRQSGAVGRVLAVAPVPVRESITGVDVWLPDQGRGAANILHGLSRADPDAPALVCTSDLPLLTPAAVRAFVARCTAEAEVSVGVVRSECYRAAFPDAPPSEFVPLRESGPVTIGCLFRVRPAVLRRNRALLDRAFDSRKSQAGMAALLGPRLLWQWATRSLSLDAVLLRAQRVLDCRAEALLDVPPELALDIDTPDDHAYAHARLG